MLSEAKYNKYLNIQQIREFLLHGSELPKIKSGSYNKRLKKAQKSLRKFMDKKFPDDSEHEKVMKNIIDYVSDTKDVYFEMGMESGACLVIQLLKNMLTDK